MGFFDRSWVILFQTAIAKSRFSITNIRINQDFRTLVTPSCVHGFWYPEGWTRFRNEFFKACNFFSRSDQIATSNFQDLDLGNFGFLKIAIRKIEKNEKSKSWKFDPGICSDPKKSTGSFEELVSKTCAAFGISKSINASRRYKAWSLRKKRGNFDDFWPILRFSGSGWEPQLTP